MKREGGREGSGKEHCSCAPSMLWEHFDRQSSELKGNLLLAGSEEAVYRRACLIWSPARPLVWKTLGLWCLSPSVSLNFFPTLTSLCMSPRCCFLSLVVDTYQDLCCIIQFEPDIIMRSATSSRIQAHNNFLKARSLQARNGTKDVTIQACVYMCVCVWHVHTDRVIQGLSTGGLL